MTVAQGSDVVHHPRQQVWEALAVLVPYCAVCDVSYVVDGARMGKGVTFACAPGRLTEQRPPAGAPRGEIVEWRPQQRVSTRIELAAEVWTTTIDLADAGAGATRVAITLTHEPRHRRRRAFGLVERVGMRRMLQRTVEAELAKVPEHIEQAARGRQ